LDIQRYLDRINYAQPIDASIETLRGLHRAHMLSVPFENLDIHLGRPILLGETIFFNKIVERRRGGFCYELNGLFAGLLRQIGFDVTMLSAGVAGLEGTFGPDFDHMALLVRLKDVRLKDDRLENDWLADVGFGDSFIEPIRLHESTVTEDATGAYRITNEGRHRILQRRGADGEDGWRQQYRFTLEPRQLSEYEDMCHYQQTSPESHFTQHRICSLATPTGRITLTGDKLITTNGEIREEHTLSGEHEFNTILAQRFGIVL
jgi:N-hydroxyarylamine O-acetyltransferase